MSLIRSEVVTAERALRQAVKFAGSAVSVPTVDLVVLLTELDRARVRVEQANAAAVAALDLSVPIPTLRAVGRG